MNLEIRNIQCGYGKLTVLQDISVSIDGGSVGLFGPNGAGKTTLINAIIGLVPLRNGEIYFNDERIDTKKTHEIVRSGISAVPQERELFPAMTVLENLQVGAENIERARPHIESSLEQVFSYFPILKERRRQIAGTMSGGQQRMLAVGRALMARPKMLILDEPSLGLQPSIVHELFSILHQMRKDVVILLTEQNVRESLLTVDRGYILENGAIVLEGTADELTHNPKVAQAYLGL
jgi:branched-chain amino acid transport system ATP-binding protein